MNRIKSWLSEFKLSNYIEVSVNFLFSVYLLGFLADHFFIIKYAMPAIFLLIVVGGGLVFGVYKLSLYYSIDLNSSIRQTQKNIEKLKYYERLEKNMLYVVIPLFSTAFIIVIAKALFSFDLYTLGSWLIIYTGGSFIVALIVIFILKKFPDKNLQNAITFLKEINEFE
jgi:hypothetical protein